MLGWRSSNGRTDVFGTEVQELMFRTNVHGTEVQELMFRTEVPGTEVALFQ